MAKKVTLKMTSFVAAGVGYVRAEPGIRNQYWPDGKQLGVVACWSSLPDEVFQW